MDWNQILTLFDGQGLVFWGAVTAVALGLTLLSVSIVFQVRKLVGNRGLGLFARRGRRAAGHAARAAGITVTEDGYQADTYLAGTYGSGMGTENPSADRTGADIPESAPAAAATAGEDMSARLLDRLRTAADRLDGIHSTLRSRGSGAVAGHSQLKGRLPGVDYVYKSGRA